MFLVLFMLPATTEECTLTYFYSITCSHCAKERAFLNKLEKQYPELLVERIDVDANPEFWKNFSK